MGLFADGAAVRITGGETFRVATQYVDGMMTVNTDEICQACYFRVGLVCAPCRVCRVCVHPGKKNTDVFVVEHVKLHKLAAVLLIDAIVNHTR